MTSRRLKLYSDRSWLPPGRETSHVTALTPFWGRTTAGSAGWPDYADRLIEAGKEFLELTELADTDIAVFPLSARVLLREPGGLERAQAFHEDARAAGKPSVFFYDPADTQGHTHGRFPIDESRVFRGSLFRTFRAPNEFALPGFHDDLLKHTGGEVRVRPKSSKPVVSFCGGLIREHAPANALARARRVAGGVRHFTWRLQGRHEEDLFIRAKAVDALLAQSEVETNIIIRESGGGGAWSGFDDAQWNIVRAAYVENMVESDYVLCTRGDGNWSIRLYEALSLGRIPVFIDTDCVLPYEFLLPWRDYCVWLERTDVKDIGTKVAAFHERLSEDDYVELQRACRRLWEDYLSPLGFFRNFHRHFDDAS